MLFDVYLDGTFVRQNIQLGTSGTWPVNLTVTGAGNHTVTVQIYPLVASGPGYQTCLGRGVTATQTFNVSCPLTVTAGPCVWSPAAPVPPGTTSTGNCLANVSGGIPPYNLLWTDSTGAKFPQAGPANNWVSPVLTCLSPGVIQLSVNDAAGTAISNAIACP